MMYCVSFHFVGDAIYIINELRRSLWSLFDDALSNLTIARFVWAIHLFCFLLIHSIWHAEDAKTSLSTLRSHLLVHSSTHTNRANIRWILLLLSLLIYYIFFWISLTLSWAKTKQKMNYIHNKHWCSIHSYVRKSMALIHYNVYIDMHHSANHEFGKMCNLALIFLPY